MRRTVKGSWAVAVVAVTTIGSSVSLPAQAATTAPTPVKAAAGAQGGERGKIPGTPAPKFTDKKQAGQVKASPTVKRQGPSAESNAWVSSHRWAAPGKVAMGSSGATPGAGTWWRFAGAPVVSSVAPSGGGQGLAAAVADDSVAAPGLGVQSFSSVEWFAMREGLAVGVNRANGNVMVRSTDLKINGVGAGTRVEAWINTLSTRTGALGAKAGIGGGQDVGLEIGTSSMVFRGPSGFRATFTGSGNTWAAPAGMKDTTLSKTSDGRWVLRKRGSGQRFVFSSGGMLLQVIDRNGIGVTYSYNADNTAKDVTDAAGRRTTFTYDSAKRVTQVSDPAGRTVKYGYTAAGQLASITDANGNTTKITWIASGQLSTITTARGVWLGFGYDANNRVVSVARRDGLNGAGALQGTGFSYPSATQTVQTNPLGKKWTYDRNAAGLVTAVTDPNGNKKSVTWSANNSVQTATDAMNAGSGAGDSMTYDYTAGFDPKSVKTPDGALTSAQYTDSGCSGTENPNRDRPSCVTDDAGNKSQYSYDAVGNLTQASDATGGATGGRDLQYTYSKAGSTTWGTNCSNIPGQMCTAKDGNGNVTAYWYDGYGNMVKIEAPAPLGARRLEYDGLGRVVKSTNGRGQVIETSYDNLDHVISQHMVGTNNPLGDYTVNYTYDVDSNLTYNTDSTITYDAQNRQVSLKDQASKNTAAGSTVAYDAAGNVIAKTDEVGATTGYAYDGANQLLAITAPGATCTTDNTSQVGCVKFTYNANGKETQRVFPGNVTQTTNYVKGRLVSVQLKNQTNWLGDFAYNYTPAGKTTPQSNVASMRDITHNGLDYAAKDTYTTTYTYDSLKRLTKAVETCTDGCTPASWSYAYDKNGNLTSRTASGDLGYAPAGTTTYGYNGADQITTVNGETGKFGYDADGNETTAPASSAAWTQPRDFTTWSSQDGTVSIDTPDGGNHFSFENSNPDQGAMFEAHGTIIQQSPLGADSWADTTGRTVKYIVMPSGKPVAYTTDGVWQSLLTDKLGSVRVITGANGGITAQYTYDPYGGFRNVWEYVDEAHANKIQYAGAYYDTNLGIYRMGVRWYDPGLGRFTNPDPSTKEANAYLYAGGNPVNFFDPMGTSLISTVAGGLAGKAVGYGLAAAGGAFACGATAGLGCAVGVAMATATIGGAAGGLAGAAVGQRGDDLRDDVIGGAIGALTFG